MGNSMFRKPNIARYKHTFLSMDNEDIEQIQKYKIIENTILDKYIINQIMVEDKYFDIYPRKSKEHEEKEKFKNADYICNKRIKVCINLKKILDNNTEEKTISWVKKS